MEILQTLVSKTGIKICQMRFLKFVQKIQQKRQITIFESLNKKIYLLCKLYNKNLYL